MKFNGHKGIAMFISLFLCIQGRSQVLAPLEVSYHIKETYMQEISGLIADSNTQNGNYSFWALADGGAPAKLYKYELKHLDSFTIGNPNETDTARLIDSTSFINASNIDWEELTQSPSHIFIGDFGNNRGNRKDLRIYRFNRSHLGSSNVKVDTLNISYANQTDFSSKMFHPWDCEAMYWNNDSLILLSKGLANSKIYIYKIPDKPGTYSMLPSDSFQSTQLVTGATNHLGKSNQLPRLAGYNFNSSFKLLSAFSYLSFPFQNLWSSEPSERLLKPHQVESIAAPIVDLPILQMAFASEKYEGQNARIYAYGIYGSAKHHFAHMEVMLSPNPAKNDLLIELKTNTEARLIICNSLGKWLRNQPINKGANHIDVTGLTPGTYFIRIYASGFKMTHATFIKN